MIFLFVPTYFAIYNIALISSDGFTAENTTKIEIIGESERLLAEYTSKNDIKIYIKTLEDAVNVDSPSRDLQYEQPLIMRLYKGDKQFVYGMYLSQNTNDCLIVSSTFDYLLMAESDAKRILNTTLSDGIYKNNKIPIGILYEGETGELLVYPSEGEWMLKKPDENFYPSTATNVLKSSNSAKAYQNKPFDIKFSIEPDWLHVDVRDGKEIIYSDIYSNFVENFFCDGIRELQYVFSAEWHKTDESEYCGNATYVLDVKYYVPAKFEISQTEADPGDIVAITAYNMSDDENLSLATDMGYETKFVSVGAHKVALIPISSDFAGQTFKLTLTSDVNDPIEYYLKINEKTYQSQNTGAQDGSVTLHLETGPQSQKQSKYNEIFMSNSEEGKKYWTEKFVMPKEGRIILEYGWTITTNLGHPYINKGINIETAKGDPIRAANAGKVVFAEEIPDDGKLVVIDHGMGIKTWYGHLDQIDVKVGDVLTKGQQLGSAGTSGMFSTINTNLYFAVSVKNIFVNPLSVINNQIPGIDTAGTEGAANFENLENFEDFEQNTENLDEIDDSDIPEADSGA
ncbi:MAG: M23 family metallopeptidase [Oscillospiraceae bacterium]|nr:M23 family metallopeptidase [Oscillospiraceae bacterium]